MYCYKKIENVVHLSILHLPTLFPPIYTIHIGFKSRSCKAVHYFSYVGFRSERAKYGGGE